MYKWPYSAWTRAGTDAWALGLEASTVIGLRMAKCAMGGPAASEEMQRMLSEKLDAALELPGVMLSGGLGASPATSTRKVIRHYRRKVSANRKRLS